MTKNITNYQDVLVFNELFKTSSCEIPSIFSISLTANYKSKKIKFSFI